MYAYGVASNVTLTGSGTVYFTLTSGGGSIQGTYNGSSFEFSSNADNSTIYPGLCLTAGSGYSANNCIVSSEAGLLVKDNAAADSATIYGGMDIINATVNSTTIYTGAVVLSSGALLKNCTMSGGSMLVKSNGIASGIEVSSGASMIVSNGSANDITVFSGGYLLKRGGTTTNVTSHAGATVSTWQMPVAGE